MAKTQQAVQKIEEEEHALVTANMYEEDAGGGFEEADRDSYAIPFLQILQALSPQLDKNDGAYVEGAEQGDLYNSVTAAKYGTVRVVPCHFRRTFIEWVPRNAGGGFVAEHDTAEGAELMKTATRDESNNDMLPNGNQLVDTRTHYCMVINEDGSTENVVVAMSSTQMKKSRQWMTRMQNIKLRRGDGTLFTPASYSHIYGLSTVQESNDQGKWYGWKIETIGPVNLTEHYELAKAFRDAVVSGTAKAAHDSLIEESEEAGF